MTYYGSEHIFFAKLDRFGDTIVAAAKSSAEARAAVLKLYSQVFRNHNACDPSEDEFHCVLDEIYVKELILGQADWM